MIHRPLRSTLSPYTTLFRSLMNETMKGNFDLIKEKLPSAKSFSFPSPFTEKEQAFLKKAMKIHRDDNSGFEGRDRKSTRLNSSHVSISYAVFCLKKKKHL